MSEKFPCKYYPFRRIPVADDHDQIQKRTGEKVIKSIDGLGLLSGDLRKLAETPRKFGSISDVKVLCSKSQHRNMIRIFCIMKTCCKKKLACFYERTSTIRTTRFWESLFWVNAMVMGGKWTTEWVLVRNCSQSHIYHTSASCGIWSTFWYWSLKNRLVRVFLVLISKVCQTWVNLNKIYCS